MKCSSVVGWRRVNLTFDWDFLWRHPFAEAVTSYISFTEQWTQNQLFVYATLATVHISDVWRGQNLEADAKASRPRPELRGRGQDYEVEAEAKNNYEKVPNND